MHILEIPKRKTLMAPKALNPEAVTLLVKKTLNISDHQRYVGVG
jgi:hypothetical protein